MNRAMNKRWGKKLLLLFCVLISFSCVITIPTIYNKEVKAETITIDDGPLGEKIIDIAFIDYDSYLAVTEDGSLYLWGNSLGLLGDGTTRYLSVPKKIYSNVDNNEYLTNIKKVYSGSANAGIDRKEGIGFALSKDNELYAWGDNTNYNLGLPEPKFYNNPTVVPIDANIKNRIERIVFYNDVTVLLTTDGDVYVTGRQGNDNDTGKGILGLGLSVTSTPEGFTKITKDNANNPLPYIKDIHLTRGNLFLLGDNNIIYATGDYNYTGNAGESQATAYPAPGRLSDGSALKCTKIIQRTENSKLGVIGEDNKIYQSWNGNIYERYYTVMNYYNSDQGIKEEVPDKIKNELRNMKSPNILFGGVVLTKDNYLQSWQKHHVGGFPAFVSDSFNPYYKGDILENYQNTEKLITGISNRTMILSKNGGVYIEGKKVSFGDIIVKTKK